jgi:hypothetical protein
VVWLQTCAARATVGRGGDPCGERESLIGGRAAREAGESGSASGRPHGLRRSTRRSRRWECGRPELVTESGVSPDTNPSRRPVTAAPSAAKRRAVERPIPCVAPVTNRDLPLELHHAHLAPPVPRLVRRGRGRALTVGPTRCLGSSIGGASHASPEPAETSPLGEAKGLRRSVDSARVPVPHATYTFHMAFKVGAERNKPLTRQGRQALADDLLDVALRRHDPREHRLRPRGRDRG